MVADRFRGKWDALQQRISPFFVGMSLDRHAAERRRFARLLGIDGELGSGLPIGTRSSPTAEGETDHDHRERDADRSTAAEFATRSADR